VAPALAGLEPDSDGIDGAKNPVGPASRYCGETARPWYFASTFPIAFSRPWHWTTSGLPCPCELFDHFPGSSDFSAGPFHNRPPHIKYDISTPAVRIGGESIIPAIHRFVESYGVSGSCERCFGHVGVCT
jgi:hypothetical protein